MRQTHRELLTSLTEMAAKLEAQDLRENDQSTDRLSLRGTAKRIRDHVMETEALGLADDTRDSPEAIAERSRAAEIIRAKYRTAILAKNFQVAAVLDKLADDLEREEL